MSGCGSTGKCDPFRKGYLPRGRWCHQRMMGMLLLDSPWCQQRQDDAGGARPGSFLDRHFLCIMSEWVRQCQWFKIVCIYSWLGILDLMEIAIYNRKGRIELGCVFNRRRCILYFQRHVASVGAFCSFWFLLQFLIFKSWHPKTFQIPSKTARDHMTSKSVPFPHKPLQGPSGLGTSLWKSHDFSRTVGVETSRCS